MPVTQSASGKYKVLAVSGDIRGGESDYRKLQMLGFGLIAESPLLAVNLKNVTFIDSQTLGLLVDLLRTAQVAGGEVVLLSINERARKWFQLSGLDKLFRIVADESGLSAAPAAPRCKAALEQVNVERMVAELEAALGEAGVTGEPSAAVPIDEQALCEIEKLLRGS